MTLQTPMRRLFAKVFPRRSVACPLEAAATEEMAEEKRRALAAHYLSQGEMALLQGSLSALSSFEAASRLDPANPSLWYRQGLAFFEYGSEEGKEKSLLIAGKNFKIATQLNPKFFEAWVAWGNTLLQLGRFHEEHHFLLDAKDKYQRALNLAEGASKELLAELHRDRGIVFAEIAGFSGEAHDLKEAISAFHEAEKLLSSHPAEFLHDVGKAYLDLSLLVNDTRACIKAAEYLQKATQTAPAYFDGWNILAECFAQIYVSTLDDKYAHLASDAYEKAATLDPQNPDVWLAWAQTLGEAGKNGKDVKLLRLSIEKCARASGLDEENPSIACQWIEALSYLGLLTDRLDLLVEAENKAIKAAEEFPDDPELWHAYGICLTSFGSYFEDGDFYEMAIEKLQIGLSLDRSDPELWHALGLAHKIYAEYADAGDLIERAARFLTKAMDLKPSCPALLFDTASTMLELSEILDDSASLEHSIVLFEQLLQNYKEALLRHPEWLFRYALALEWLGHRSEEERHVLRAIEIYAHVLLIDPDFATIHHRLALSYVEVGHLSGNSESYKRAIHFFRLATRNEEENGQIWLNWGSCLMDLAHHTFDDTLMHQLYLDAEEKIAHAGVLGCPDAYYTLSALYSVLGRLYESMELLNKALSLRALPSIEELYEDDRLDNLRATEPFRLFIADLEARLQQTREE